MHKLEILIKIGSIFYQMTKIAFKNAPHIQKYKLSEIRYDACGAMQHTVYRVVNHLPSQRFNHLC